MLFQAKLTRVHAYDGSPKSPTAGGSTRRMELFFTDASNVEHRILKLWAQHEFDYFQDHVGNTYTLRERDVVTAFGKQKRIGFHTWPVPPLHTMGPGELATLSVIEQARLRADRIREAGKPARDAIIQREHPVDPRTITPSEAIAKGLVEQYKARPYATRPNSVDIDHKPYAESMYAGNTRSRHAARVRGTNGLYPDAVTPIPVRMYVVTTDGLDIEATLADWRKHYFPIPERIGDIDKVAIAQNMWFDHVRSFVLPIASRGKPDCEQLWAMREFIKQVADFWDLYKPYPQKSIHPIVMANWRWAVDYVSDHNPVIVGRRSAWDRLCDLFAGRAR